MKIENIKVADLVPYARNAKRHDESQVAKIAGSIKEYGFTNPVLIDKDNGIIAGHGRVMAAQKLGLSEGPCIRLDHLTDAQRRAYILADNRLSEIGGGWDLEMLKLELEELDIPLQDIGFDDLLIQSFNGDEVESPIVEMEPLGNSPLAERTIHVHFKNAIDANEFARLIGQKISIKTKSIWHPTNPQ